MTTRFPYARTFLLGFGRGKPWILVGAPLAAIFFIFIPMAGTIPAIMIAMLLSKVKDPFRSLKSQAAPA